MDKKPLGVALCVLLAGCGSDDDTSTTCTMSGKVEQLKPNEIYTDYGDWTILDTETGLMWSVCDLDDEYPEAGEFTCMNPDGSPSLYSSWSSAMAAAQTATEEGYLGYSDWRVPNVKELLSLVEPAGERWRINCQFGITQSDYFSSSPVASEPSRFWLVSYMWGGAAPAEKDDVLGAVRLVRDAD